MTTNPVELDLDAIEAAAKAATPGPWHWVNPQTDQPRQPGEWRASLRTVELYPTSDYMLPKFIAECVEIDDHNIEGNADFIAAANPDVVLELVRRLRAAEALGASRIEQIPTDTQVLAIFADIEHEHRREAEEFSKAIQARCGRRTLVAYFPTGCDVSALDDEAMAKVGWVRK